MKPIIHLKPLTNMNLTQNKRWLAYTLIFLLVLNISALGTILFLTYRPHHEFMPPGPYGPMGKIIEKELNLDPRQREEFRELRREFFNETKPVLDSLKVKRDDIFKGMSDETPDTAKLYRTADEFGHLHGLLKRMAINHFMKVKAKCTPEQRKHLSELYRQILESDGPGRGRQFRHGMGPEGRQGHERWD